MTCRWCKGSGRVQLLTSLVDCDCMPASPARRLIQLLCPDHPQKALELDLDGPFLRAVSRCYATVVVTACGAYTDDADDLAQLIEYMPDHMLPFGANQALLAVPPGVLVKYKVSRLLFYCSPSGHTDWLYTKGWDDPPGVR